MTRSGSAHVPAHEDVACHIDMCHVTQAHPAALPRAPNFNVEDLRMHGHPRLHLIDVSTERTGAYRRLVNVRWHAKSASKPTGMCSVASKIPTSVDMMGVLGVYGHVGKDRCA